MRTSTARTLAIGCVAFAPLACSLLSLPDVVGGSLAADGGAEASADAVAAGDGTADGEAGAPGDAGLDRDAAAGDPCTRPLTPALADSFDNGGLGASWTSTTVQDGGTLSFDTNLLRSSPRSLRSTSTAGALAFLTKSLGSVSHVVVDVSVRADVLSSHAIAPVFIRTYAGVVAHYTFLYLYSTMTLAQFFIDDGTSQVTSYALTPGVPEAQWARVRMDLTLAGASTRLLVCVDGRIALDRQSPYPSFAPGPAEVVLGLGQLEPPYSNVAVNADDFTVEAQ